VYVANYEGSSISVLRDSAGGVEEAPNAGVRTRNAATVVRDILFLPEAVSGEQLAVCAQLLDISGRKVLDLHPGANDVSRLSTGVYFVRSTFATRRSTLVTKVVVTR
jgi:hypothetical protein